MNRTRHSNPRQRDCRREHQRVLAVPDDIDLAGESAIAPTSAYNLIGAGGTSGLTGGVNGNLVGVVKRRARRATSNGGLTPTIALLPGSPAVGAGSSLFATNPATGHALDHRSACGFPRTVDGLIDIGAYQLQSSPRPSIPAPASVTAVAVDWGTQSAALETATDGPRAAGGRNNDLPWLGVDRLSITLSEPTTLSAADISMTGLDRIAYAPVTITGSGTNFTVTFAQPIDEADRVTITIAGAGLGTYTRRLDVLPGDFTDNGVVNNQDITAIRNEWKDKRGAQPTIFGEIVGDGTVDNADYRAVLKHNGTRLPKLAKTGGAGRAKVVLSRTLSLQRHANHLMK